ncbi:uncharacterized protein LACBIDRAFT_294111 [Laccaria bicolor S238N-H82]|uniref:Predicted protein n=1 Tax=Laccaria bicolor (strain S238N-H82 / ATCC MYA-4686) TaxID=486041 RepID=B0D847_LACBS|nr:uncharacterized protein LACBIDRAFT_294111 [Laccaria bicolor S238N-H82]EDR09248.1 predicted protein [Laccaria bicolor S238N-H82]|eukprot:XP_001880561.1 predicted protein [Laccaria bicolor S238N-H82]
MRWSPLASIITLLAVTSIFEGVAAAPVAVVIETRGNSEEAAKLKLQTGLKLAAKVTLGPKGRNVVLEKKFGSPTITKDGVSIAKEIEIKNHLKKT